MESQIFEATFAGGCFWCMEPPFDNADGVVETLPGYAGGHVNNPSYEDVCRGITGHLEVIRIRYDGSKISFEQLLDIFWKNVNPTDAEGQFVDRGEQYKTAIFYHDEEQRLKAEESKLKLENLNVFKSPVVTEIRPLKNFFPAEDYHHKFYKTNSERYQSYKNHSGREDFIKSVWSKDR